MRISAPTTTKLILLLAASLPLSAADRYGWKWDPMRYFRGAPGLSLFFGQDRVASGGGGNIPTLLDGTGFATAAGAAQITTGTVTGCSGADSIDVATFNFAGTTASLTLTDSTNGGSSFGVNTYTNIGNYDGGSGYDVGVWRVQHPTTSGSMRWRIANSGGANYPTMEVACYQNVTGGVVNSNGNTTGSATIHLPTNSASATRANQLVVGIWSWTTGTLNSVDSGCTLIQNVPQAGGGGSLAFCNLLSSGAAAYDITATLSTTSGGAGAMIYIIDHN